MKSTSEMPILTLEGDALTRGRIYGESVKETIREQVERMKVFMAKALEIAPEAAAAQFIADTSFLPAIEKWTPYLIDEMKGIAEGSGVDFIDIHLLNLGDEVWWYFKEQKGEFSNPVVGADSCSSMGAEAQPGLPTLVAQNLDMPDYYDGLQVLQHIKDPETGLEIYAISFAGVVGTVGMNNHGLGMCQNTLMDLAHAADGLPVQHLSRGILEQPTLEEAVSFVHKVKHASGQNYVIGSPEGVVDYECSANKVRRFLPYEGANKVYHTNHPFVNDDCHEKGVDHENSEARFKSVEADMKALQGPLTVDGIKKILSSHASAPFEVCVHPSEKKKGITANCLIMELDANPRLHYTAGPPCETDFKTVMFS